MVAESDLCLYNEDYLRGSQRRIESNSVDLMICDPPFGLGESKLDVLYNRDDSQIIGGYQEAPADYAAFAETWIEEAARILRPGGSLVAIVGHTPLLDTLLAIRKCGLRLVNHCIWRYNFGVFTRRKFVTSHYHLLWVVKRGKTPTFNTDCRYGSMERDSKGGSLQYQDREDVWSIKREYRPRERKNANKLPDALLEKIILYLSNPDDLVCDFFLGNFTTACVARGLGRRVLGFEINKEAFAEHAPKVRALRYGTHLAGLRQVNRSRPLKQGQKITAVERSAIRQGFHTLVAAGSTKAAAIANLCLKHQRGRFGIINILKGIATA
jgi:site-specific DNA-methyltransferase (adenine-specific)